MLKHIRNSVVTPVLAVILSNMVLLPPSFAVDAAEKETAGYPAYSPASVGKTPVQVIAALGGKDIKDLSIAETIDLALAYAYKGEFKKSIFMINDKIDMTSLSVEKADLCKCQAIVWSLWADWAQSNEILNLREFCYQKAFICIKAALRLDDTNELETLKHKYALATILGDKLEAKTAEDRMYELDPSLNRETREVALVTGIFVVSIGVGAVLVVLYAKESIPPEVKIKAMAAIVSIVYAGAMIIEKTGNG